MKTLTWHMDACTRSGLHLIPEFLKSCYLFIRNVTWYVLQEINYMVHHGMVTRPPPPPLPEKNYCPPTPRHKGYISRVSYGCELEVMIPTCLNVLKNLF